MKRSAAPSLGSGPLWIVAVMLVAFGAALVRPAFAAGKGEPGPVLVVRVEIGDREEDLRRFREMDLDVDGVFDGWARIYVVQEELDKLGRLGFEVSPLSEPELAFWYHMAGGSIGTHSLEISVDDCDTWDTAFEMEGEQGYDWLRERENGS